MLIAGQAAHKIIASKGPATCAHCKKQMSDMNWSADWQKYFCCHGCESVYGLIHSQGLKDFYQIQKNMGGLLLSQENSSLNSQSEENPYSYIDGPLFLKEHGRFEENKVSMDFYIEGVTCYACVWLIEKLPTLHPEIIDLHFSSTSFALTITIKESSTFAPLLWTLDKLGHRSRVLENYQQIQEWQNLEERMMLKRLAVAGAVFGNVMLLSIAQYAGSGAFLSQLFSWISLVITLPSVFFSARPFFTQSYLALKSKQITMDVPLSLAIVLGLAGSVWSIITTGQHHYLDSITGLIFLVLITRYIMRISARHSFKSVGAESFFEKGGVKIWDEEKQLFKNTHRKYIKLHDRLLIENGQMVPVEGPLESLECFLNTAFLTGESFPQKFQQGDLIPAGPINAGATFIMQAQTLAAQTPFGKLLERLRLLDGQKSSIVQSADKIARYFLSAVLILAGFELVTMSIIDTFSLALQRTLALIIVTCPCALSLATPMAMARALSLLAKKGILFKREASLESLAKIQNIFFDKTGTLTRGLFKITQVEVKKACPFHPLKWEDLLLALEEISSHPLAMAIRKHFSNSKQQQAPKLDHHQEISGVGPRARYLDSLLEVKAQSLPDHSKLIQLVCDGEIVFELKAMDQIRMEAKEEIAQLKKLGLNVYLLSGDSAALVKQVATLLNIDQDKALGALTPEEKEKIVANTPFSAMAGDGVNDALALKASDVGIAVASSMEASLNACDIYLTRTGIEAITLAIKVAKKTQKIIYRNLIFSAAFNFLAAGLALSGQITPLYAAILMPVSSLTVLFSTLLSSLEDNPVAGLEVV